MYTLISAEMPQTTVISIGHRSTLNSFHQAGLFLDKNLKNYLSAIFNLFYDEYKRRYNQ